MPLSGTNVLQSTEYFGRLVVALYGELSFTLRVGEPVLGYIKLSQHPVGLVPVRRGFDGLVQAVLDLCGSIRHRRKCSEVVPGIGRLFGSAGGVEGCSHGCVDGLSLEPKIGSLAGEVGDTARI